MVCYTRVFGRIAVRAQGLRLVGSKLRAHVGIGTLTNIGGVRGKQGWRLIYAQEEPEPPYTAEVHMLIAQLGRLILRLVHGTEPNEQLFELLRTTLAYLTDTTYSRADLDTLERLTVLRILHALGYVGEDTRWSSVVATWSLEAAELTAFRPHQHAATAAINAALHASQL